MAERATDPGVEILSDVHDLTFPGEWYALSSADHFWFQWRFRAALAQARAIGLPLDEALRVIEIGAGKGVLRDQVEGSTAWAVDMVDLRLDGLQMARAGRGRRLYYDVLEERPGFVGSYDVAVLFDVLEHVEQTQPFLRSVLRHLKPGGHLLINVPALPVLYSNYDRAAGHVRRYRPRTLAAEFDGLGVEVRDVRYWGLLLVPLLLVRKVLLGRSHGEEGVIRAGFEPPGRLAHGGLKALMHAESMLVGRPPLGSSLLLAARVPAAP